MIQLQGDQRKDVQEFLVDKKEGLELDAKTIKVRRYLSACLRMCDLMFLQGPWLLSFFYSHQPSFNNGLLVVSSAKTLRPSPDGSAMKVGKALTDSP